MSGSGRASSSFCVNGGSIKLITLSGRSTLMKTNCKTWSCLGCRNRMIALFKARVVAGVSALGRCAFITITYKAGVESERDAEYVRKDWVALFRRMRAQKNRASRWKWIRVIELTKKGTPHHHLIVGPIGVDDVISCMSRSFDVKRYRRRFGNCSCLVHELAVHWKAVTGDSYIVHGREVVGVEGAATYMAKYLTKTFMRDDRQKQTGMERRWSTSRGWPGEPRMRLRHTVEGSWSERLFRPGKVDERFLGGPADLEERVGDDIVKKLFEKGKVKKSAKELERMLRQ